jgi:ParB family chromosome partitioning protein
MTQTTLIAEPAAAVATLPARAEGKAKRHYDPGATSEWYTPGAYLDAARAAMGGIDLDPASCAHANKTVRAATYFDRAADGLSRHWFGRVWLNPPYSDFKGQAAAWATKLLAEYRAGRVEQAVLLVNLSVAYQPAFQAVARVGAVCMVDHRIQFVSAAGQSDRPTQANMLLYLGDRRRQFAAEFGQFGAVLEAVRDEIERS